MTPWMIQNDLRTLSPYRSMQPQGASTESSKAKSPNCKSVSRMKTKTLRTHIARSTPLSTTSTPAAWIMKVHSFRSKNTDFDWIITYWKTEIQPILFKIIYISRKMTKFNLCNQRRKKKAVNWKASDWT